MPEGVHTRLLDAQLLEQRMKMTTQEGGVPDGMAPAAHKEQTKLAITNVLFDEFQESGLHVDHSISVLRLRGLNLAVVD